LRGPGGKFCKQTSKTRGRIVALSKIAHENGLKFKFLIPGTAGRGKTETGNQGALRGFCQKHQESFPNQKLKKPANTRSCFWGRKTGEQSFGRGRGEETGERVLDFKNVSQHQM